MDASWRGSAAGLVFYVPAFTKGVSHVHAVGTGKTKHNQFSYCNLSSELR